MCLKTLERPMLEILSSWSRRRLNLFSSDRSLVFAIVTSLGTMAIFAGWMFFDTSFHWIFLADWDFVYYRRIAFILVAVVAVLAMLLIFVRTLVGSRRGRSLKTLFLAISIAAMWLTLWRSYEELAWRGVLWRVRRLLPHLKADAAILLQKWPDKAGELPHLGHYEVEEWGSDRQLWLSRWSPQDLSHIVVGPAIERAHGTWIAFTIDKVREVVYQPHGGLPIDANESVKHRHSWPPNRSVIQLEEEWYLVVSKNDLPTCPPSAQTCVWDEDTQRFVKRIGDL